MKPEVKRLQREMEASAMMTASAIIREALDTSKFGNGEVNEMMQTVKAALISGNPLRRDRAVDNVKSRTGKKISFPIADVNHIDDVAKNLAAQMRVDLPEKYMSGQAADQKVVDWRTRISEMEQPEFVYPSVIEENDEVESDQGSADRKIDQARSQEQLVQNKLISALAAIGDTSMLPPRLRKELGKRICGALGLLDFKEDVHQATSEQRRKKESAKANPTDVQRPSVKKTAAGPKKNPFTKEKGDAFIAMKERQKELEVDKLPPGDPVLIRYLEVLAKLHAWSKDHDPVAFRQHEKAQAATSKDD